CFFFSSRRRHTRFSRDWSSDLCSSDLLQGRMRAQKKTSAVFGRAGERATHLVGSCVAMHLLQRYWQPMPCTLLWQLPSLLRPAEIGRASCRERGEISVGAVSGREEANV